MERICPKKGCAWGCSRFAPHAHPFFGSILVQLSSYHLVLFVDLWAPIGQHSNGFVRVIGVVAFDVDLEIVGSIHAFVHHEYAGFERCALTGLENHRTDGQ